MQGGVLHVQHAGEAMDGSALSFVRFLNFFSGCFNAVVRTGWVALKMGEQVKLILRSKAILQRKFSVLTIIYSSVNSLNQRVIQ